MNNPSTRQKVGLAIAGVLNLTAIPSVLMPTPEGQVGPPYVVLMLSTVVGVIGVVAVVLAWRGSAPALRVAAGAVIIPTLTALPAFFVDVPPVVRLLVATSVLLAVAAIVLMFSTERRPVPVMD
ncbi:hypothetical protein [uncultured Serinicoccus sp.]|uniref:hypothetical protein n=1 Tax=uncultured Serinicoccus sp. TaxID=735514 RepID=UPI0026035D0E|nr:hypothetical protein [uncultured Serinicoccus sp.]